MTLSEIQKQYLSGLVMGSDVARAVRGLPILSGSANTSSTLTLGGPGANSPQINTNGGASSLDTATSHLPPLHAEAVARHDREGKNLCNEEKAKRDKNALEGWTDIEQRSRNGEFPKGTDVFLTKYFGLFYVAPAQDAYMCRLRFPGGAISSAQLAGVADLADRYANGLADVTTRANLQLREIPAHAGIDVLMGLRDLGIVNTGAGADNIRNVTASPLSGLDAHELIETLPLARQLHYHILHRRELFGLPRKFNIAFEGGGHISSLAETNDIHFQAVRVPAEHANASIPAGNYFLLGLGGITGHGDFARPTNIIVPPRDCISVAEAIVKVFVRFGDRTDRKKARLKYVLDARGVDWFVTEVEKEFGRPLIKADPTVWSSEEHIDRWAHVDIHPQKQPGKSYIGIVLPVGRLTSEQMRGLANLANRFGTSELRLTVWQNILLPNIEQRDIPLVLAELSALGLEWQASSIRAGLVACTGNAGCKYAASNTKRHALELADYLQDRVHLDQPINIHLTGCHHSCAQHAIGDIGLLATKVEVEEEMVEGYHVWVGGRTGLDACIARPLFTSVPFGELSTKLESLLRCYVNQRQNDQETFAAFVARYSVDELRYMTNDSFVHT